MAGTVARRLAASACCEGSPNRDFGSYAPRSPCSGGADTYCGNALRPTCAEHPASCRQRSELSTDLAICPGICLHNARSQWLSDRSPIRFRHEANERSSVRRTYGHDRVPPTPGCRMMIPACSPHQRVRGRHSRPWSARDRPRAASPSLVQSIDHQLLQHRRPEIEPWERPGNEIQDAERQRRQYVIQDAQAHAVTWIELRWKKSVLCQHAIDAETSAVVARIAQVGAHSAGYSSHMASIADRWVPVRGAARVPKRRPSAFP